MGRTPYVRDDGRYMTYYMNQAGGDLQGFIGASTQYGNGLGGMFRSLFRMAIPLLKRGFNIAKPHLRTAASNIMGDVVSKITKHNMDKQEGHGMLVHMKRPLKRPPVNRGRSRTTNKRRKTGGRTKKPVKKKTAAKRSRSQGKRAHFTAKDIF